VGGQAYFHECLDVARQCVGGLEPGRGTIQALINSVRTGSVVPTTAAMATRTNRRFRHRLGGQGGLLEESPLRTLRRWYSGCLRNAVTWPRPHDRGRYCRGYQWERGDRPRRRTARRVPVLSGQASMAGLEKPSVVARDRVVFSPPSGNAVLALREGAVHQHAQPVAAARQD
jgi:hypothetical protein